MCCPQEGYAYDFERRCFDTKKQVVFCYEQRDPVLDCGSEGAMWCYQRVSGGPEAWFTLGTWTGFPEDVTYERCELSPGAAPGDFLNIPYCGDGGTPVGTGPP